MFIERRDKDANYYEELQSRTLDLLQQLSGNVWTDFNMHDPGITIADIFNYALYELHYIFQFPFESYLNIEKKKESEYHKKGFLSARYLFSDSIVTTADYQNLIVDSVTDVEACRVSLNDTMRYHIEVQLVADADENQVRKEIETLYHCNRNLCETLGEISFVNHIETTKTDNSDSRPQTLETRKSDTFVPKMPSRYYSIQNHFPESYGISQRGLSSEATEEYKAVVLQLKAYLLIFDYMLADTENQAKNIQTLLDLSKGIPEKEIFTIDIPDIEKLIDKNRMEEENIHSSVFWQTQKSRFLDTLDSIYGENTKRIFKQFDLPNQNEKRTKIIPLFPGLNRNRFHSFNILDESDNISGIKQIVTTILGHHSGKEIPVTNFFAHYRLRLLDDRIFFTEHKYKLSVNIVEETPLEKIEKIEKINILFEEKDYKDLYTRISILWHNILYESFLLYGFNIDNYRFIHQHEKGYLLIFKIPKRDEWFAISRFYEKEALIKTANIFCRFIWHLNIKSQTFYPVEHILLNNKTTIHDYNKLTIATPRWTKNIYNKEKYEEIIAERLPVHLEVVFVWLSADEICYFEQVYFQWRKAMADSNQTDISKFSEALKDIIEK